MVTAAMKLKGTCYLWKKSYDQPRQHIKKQSHYFANKGLSCQSYDFSSGCESCTIKKAECRRIDAFELWCWRRLLRVPWTARRSNKSILKEISPEYSLEGMMLKLMWTDSLEKTLIAGKNWRQEEKGMTEHEMVGRHHQFNGHEFEQTLEDSEGQGSLACCSSWSCKESDMTEWLNNNILVI